MSERLASTTRDMLAAHSRLYDVQEQHNYAYEKKRFNAIQSSPDVDSLASMSTVETPHPSSSTSVAYPYIDNAMAMQPMSMQQPLLQPYQQIQQQHQRQQQHNNQQEQQQQQLQQQHQGGNIDFNSCEYLYDSALFGQIIFDSAKINNSDMNYLPSQQQEQYSAMLNEATNYQQPYSEGQKNNGPWGT